MASVAPEVTIARPGVPGERPLLRPPVIPDPSVRRWLSVLARRLVLLDVLLVSAAVGGALWVRFGENATTESVIGLETYPLSWSYLLMSIVLGAGWALSLGMSRVYDRKVLGIGVEK